jgi:hypothetical protein
MIPEGQAPIITHPFSLVRLLSRSNRL